MRNLALRLRFFHENVRAGIGVGKNAEAQYIGDHERRLAGAVHAKIGELIRRKALGMQGAKTGFIAKERTASHDHAAGEQIFDWRIEPDNGNALCSQEFGRAGLCVGPAAECDHRGFARFERASESCAKLCGF